MDGDGNVFFDVDLAVNVKTLVKNDAGIMGDALKTELNSFSDDNLLLLKKVMNSPLKIVSITKIDAEFIKKNVKLNIWV